MILCRLGEVARAVGGELRGDPELGLSGVAVDSREVRSGDLFFALPGERTDGHLHLRESAERGARAAVVSRAEVLPPSLPAVVVEDTRKALGLLAAWHRRKFPVEVIGITGSVGKTTTKDLLSQVLARRWPILSTEGNLNTDVGLPLTLFRLQPHHRYAVLEMAMRAPGEIRWLCQISLPRYGVITRIAPVHLETLGSMEAIVRAKGELLESLPPEGAAFLNSSDPWQEAMAALAPCPLLWYGRGERASVRAREVREDEEGLSFILVLEGEEWPVRMKHLAGHHVEAALGAAAVARHLGLPGEEIAFGLEGAVLSPLRWEVREKEGVRLVFDCYNASPEAVKAALRSLSAWRRGRRFAVLGGMLELGPLTEAAHLEVGEEAARTGLEELVVVGELGELIARGASRAGFPPERVFRARDAREAASFLRPRLREGDAVLVKGSRLLRLEEMEEGLS